MKAIGLLSGGLDSRLALKLILDQGIEVTALNFVTSFCNCTSKKSCSPESKKAADELGIPLVIKNISEEFIQIVKNPKHGYGRNLNPCIDCRINIFVHAKKFMDEIGASFIVTGEVLGERPMSQRREAIEMIERESGLNGLVVRPLSAKLFPPTIPETKGWIDREKLLDIRGRSRKPQIELAKQFSMNDYPCPAGGCLLTDDIFADRLRESLRHDEDDLRSVNLLKIGRHFRLSSGIKIVVGRDDRENNSLMNFFTEKDIICRVKDWPGPLVLLRNKNGGEITGEDIDAACGLCVYHSDAKNEKEVDIEVTRSVDKVIEMVKSKTVSKEFVDSIRI